MTPAKTVTWRTLGLALVACLHLSPTHAQDQKEKDLEFWEVRQRQQVGSAAQLIMARNPFTVAVLRDEGLRWKVWLEPEFLGDTVPALNSEWLNEIRDDTPMPDMRGKLPDELRKDQRAVFNTWNQAVLNAFNTPADAFAKSAEENSHVTFAHLWNNPGLFRGKVIPIKGRLVRLRKWDSTSAVKKAGVPFVYEGWIFGPTERSRPFWVIFPTLPDGLKEADKMDRVVSFNGYFIKNMKYPAGDGSKKLETPLLIGPTVTLAPAPPPELPTTPVSMGMVAVVMGVIVAVGIGLVLLNWYFHRGDKALKQRLARMQAEGSANLIDHPASEEIRTGDPSRN